VISAEINKLGLALKENKSKKLSIQNNRRKHNNKTPHTGNLRKNSFDKIDIVFFAIIHKLITVQPLLKIDIR